MNDFIFNVLTYIAIALFYVVSCYVVKYISAKVSEINATTKNENAKNILEEAEKAIADAVLYTSQTFVDSLKKENLFDADKQKEALNIALSKALKMMSGKSLEFIKATYGDINEWVIVKIEKYVKKSK